MERSAGWQPAPELRAADVSSLSAVARSWFIVDGPAGAVGARQLQALVRPRSSWLRFLQARGSRDANLSFVLDRSSQSYEVQLTVCVEQACRSVICVRSADHVQPRIG